MNAKTYMLGCLKHKYFGCLTYSGPQIEAWLRKRNPGCPDTLWQRIVKAASDIREIRRETAKIRKDNERIAAEIERLGIGIAEKRNKIAAVKRM